MARPFYTHLTSFAAVRPSVNRSARMDTPTAMCHAGSGTARRGTSAGALVARCARC
jgi:hypothetical protein